MAGFLRKFATNSKKNAGVERKVASPVNHPAIPSKSVSNDPPPSLPPLFARFATSALAEPDSISLFSSYISSPIPPVPKLDDHTLPSGEWDAWKALIDPPPVSTPDSPDPDPPALPPKAKKPSSSPPLPVTRRKYTGPGLPNKLAHGNTSSDVTRSISPDPSPRTVHAAPTRQDRNQQHSDSATPPIATTFRDSAVVLPSPKEPTRLLSPEQDLITNPRGSAHPSSPSLDNQVPSYTPLNSRHAPPASQCPPSLPGLQTATPLQKPASTSSHNSTATQSSSNHSHVTQAGSVSTAFTSTSSIAPAIKQLDVMNSGAEMHPSRSSSGLRLARPNPFSPRSSTPGSTLNNANANTTSAVVGKSYSPLTHRALPTSSSPSPAEPPSRNLTHSTMSVTTTTRTTCSPVPPSAMPFRQNARPLAVRPLTQADNTPQHLRGSLLDSIHSRGVSLELSTPPVRKGPLIFAAIASDISPPDNSPVVGMNANTNANKDINIKGSVSVSPARRAADHDDHDETRAHARGYPSPPAEYVSLEQTGARRVPSLSSSGHGHVHGRVSSSGHGHEHGRSSFETGRMSLSEATIPPTRKMSRTGSTVRMMTATTTSTAVPETSNSKTRTLTKTRSRSRPPTPASSSTSHAPKLPMQDLSSEALFSEDALFFDADPFAKVEGVQVVKTQMASCEDESVSAIPLTPPTRPKSPLTPESPENYKTARTQRRGQWLEKMRPPVAADAVVQQEVMDKEAEFLQQEEEARVRTEEERRLKEEKEQEERRLEEQRLKEEEQERLRREATVYPIVKHMSDASLLPHLLTYLTFSDWCSLYGATKEIRKLFENRVLREYVLEHFLLTVAYSRWNFEWAEPLALSLKDLNDYMRGVSMPTYQYGQLAEAYLQPRIKNPGDAIPQVPNILALAMTTRAYTRVVMRLRAQAESEARVIARAHVSPVGSMSRSSSRAGTHDKHAVVLSRFSSRAPSPASSANSFGRPSTSSSSRTTFRSPLVKLHRAPLLRVFVPSPEGEWLSDSSVVECEAELKRAGVLKLMRVGDVVWDVAVGDEGNLGRMVWDGSYLVDLDHKYSRMGELSPYFHSLAFSPSYFHRVIRTGVNAATNPDGNPIVYLDVSPWGKELATNLQLLQDRATTTTPHGALHSVIRWVHRSSFTIRPPVSPHHPHAYSHMQNLRLPIPNVDGFFIDPGWYGTVVIESEGTNEGLADFQDRCGPGAFPPRAHNITSKMRSEKEKDSRRVFRVLREKSRPGEIWIRAVREKERVM